MENLRLFLRSVLSFVVPASLITTSVMILFIIVFYEDIQRDDVAENPPEISEAFMAATIVWGFFAAVVGGVLCALIAGRNEWRHAYVLIGVFLGMSLFGMATSDGREPLWVQIGNLLAMVGGISLGVWLYLYFKPKNDEPEAIETDAVS